MLNPKLLATLRSFRQELYDDLGLRQDSLFELVDAVLSTPERRTLVRLSLCACFRRRWPSACAALADGTLEVAGLRALFQATLPVLAPGDRPLWVVDGTHWPRPAAATSPARTWEHRPLPGKPQQGVVPAWAYHWLVQVPETDGSWVLPLDVQRRGPTAGTPTQLAIGQIAQTRAGQPPAALRPVVALDSAHEVAQLTPQEFVERLVVGTLGARAVLVGDNFRYGHRHAGDVELLKKLGGKLGFETEIVPAVSCRGRVVSSSGIRELIRAGRVNLAARFLTHPYGLQGRVVTGRGVGSKQTVPTLNLASEAEVVPASGVYITRTRDLDAVREWNSITNVGYRPTFGKSDELTVETFLLDPLQGETPSRIRVDFLQRVREERKFDSPEALRAQIFKDVGTARRYFRRLKTWAGRACISC